MVYRAMAKTNNSSSFTAWLEEKNNESDTENNEDEGESSLSLLGQVYSIQETLTSQMQELSGSLPDAGPLSAGFRKRLRYSIYLLFASAIFLALALLIGLPTLILKPSKFVICITLSTILAAASVIVLQKPSVFLSNLIKSGVVKALPVILLLTTSLGTIYITVFIHRYIFVILAACIQLASLFWYLASFVPGGTRGLTLLTRASYVILGTMLRPVLFVCKKTTKQIVTYMIS